MSTDSIALFDVSVKDVNAQWLLAQVAEDPTAFDEVVDLYRDFWQKKVWEIAISPAPGGTDLVGPGGFWISFEPRTIELYHMMKFSTFTSEPASRNALRRACLWIAERVGSARVIFTHELMPHSGEGLEQIETGLHAQIGPPAASFEQLRTAEYFGPRAWYIDTFADLRDPA